MVTGEVSIKLDNGENYIISADPAQININKPNDTTIKNSSAKKHEREMELFSDPISTSCLYVSLLQY